MKVHRRGGFVRTPSVFTSWIPGLVLALFAIPGAAAAEDGPWNRFNLELGGVFVGADSSLTVGPASLGVNIDAERAFGFDRGLLAGYGQVDYRLGRTPRHRVALSYQLYLRSGSRTLDEEIRLGDRTFPVSATLDSQYDVQALAGKYQYSVVHDDRMDLAVGLAVYGIPLLFRTEVVAGEGGDERVSQYLWAPVPALSLRGGFAISPAWFLLIDLDWVYLDVSGFIGRMMNTRVSVEWRFADPVAVGLGFDSFRMDIEAEEGTDYPVDFTGRFRTNFAGALLYLALRL